MDLISDQRNQVIRRAVSRKPDAVAATSGLLWERLASELVPIIGEGGFQSLYARSLRLTGVAFPWMMNGHPWKHLDTGFSDLKLSFPEQDLDQVNEASVFQLTTFVDILAVLIGELLATSILHSAWGEDALNITGEEPSS